MSNPNQSLNYLIGNFVSETGGEADETIKSSQMISIDTSNGFLGFNTVDPTCDIDVSNNGTIRTGNLILYNIQDGSAGLDPSTVYHDHRHRRQSPLARPMAPSPNCNRHIDLPAGYSRSHQWPRGSSWFSPSADRGHHAAIIQTPHPAPPNPNCPLRQPVLNRQCDRRIMSTPSCLHDSSSNSGCHGWY